MSITINGNGTISGISAGGLPAGTVTSATLANSVTTGKILQVQSTTKTDTHSSTDNKADIPGTDQNGNGSVWCVKITPSATTSKILVQAMVTGTHDSIHGGLWLQRDGSDIAKSTYANGQLATTKMGINHGTSSGGQHVFTTTPILFLDSPNTTNELTYKVQCGDGGEHGTTFINRAYDQSNWMGSWKGVSTITVTEIAA
tara:strand:+ start:196 stop:795 length:600 start_codon:yes stop_codon:yes gene_type:complete